MMSLFLPSMMKSLFYWSLFLVLLSFGLETISYASELKFQTLDTSLYHLSSASNPTCNRASKTGFKNRVPTTRPVLEVVHKHGPCAHDNDEKRTKLSFAKILDNDQLRVKSIQARVAHLIDTNKLMSLDKKAKLPAQSGMLLESGNFIVTIGLGTPKRNLSLVFDTGSDLTWTQCQPCTKHNCYRQKDPIFNPHNSTSYSNISCKSKDCPQTIFGCYHNTTCAYRIVYGDNSYTKGYFSKEKLTVTPTDVFPNFLFGCGHNNSGLFGKTDGILGLGRDPISFVYQTAKKYARYFSYCLPSTIDSPGFLAFGKNNNNNNNNKATKKVMISTSFVPPPPGVPNIFYFIEITSISVGGTKLPINGSIFKKAGTVIDSGTKLTYLPRAAYNKMSKEFKNQMNKNKYRSAPPFSILDTCFYINSNQQIQVPTVSFTFKGNATLHLDAYGILVGVNSTYVCLAFAGNGDPSDLAIFGNTQQSTFEVAYDVAGNKLGFINNPKCQ